MVYHVFSLYHQSFELRCRRWVALSVLVQCITIAEGSNPSRNGAKVTALAEQFEHESGGVAAILEDDWDLSNDGVNACSQAEAKWMWGDASIVGHWVAEVDPFRWSSWKTIPDTIEELQNYRHLMRPVEVVVRFSPGGGPQHNKTYSTPDDAIVGLGHADAFAPSSKPTLGSNFMARRGVHVHRPRLLPSELDMPALQLDVPRTGNVPAASVDFEFDTETARILALMSRATYCADYAQLLQWSCPSCRESGLVITKGSVHRFYGQQCHLYGFVAKVEKPTLLGRVFGGSTPFAGTCLLALRGTSNIRNLVHDLNVGPVQVPTSWACPGCKVHAGFLKDWLDLEPKVLVALNASGCIEGGGGISVTGHSLGAALATLAVLSLRQKYSLNVNVIYTFESPRVGNKAFVDTWNARVVKQIPAFRVTSEADPVTNVPCFLGTFVHVPREVRYRSDNTFEVQTNDEKFCDESVAVSATTDWFHADAHCNLPYMKLEMCCHSFM